MALVAVIRLTGLASGFSGGAARAGATETYSRARAARAPVREAVRRARRGAPGRLARSGARSARERAVVGDGFIALWPVRVTLCSFGVVVMHAGRAGTRRPASQKPVAQVGLRVCGRGVPVGSAEAEVTARGRGGLPIRDGVRMAARALRDPETANGAAAPEPTVDMSLPCSSDSTGPNRSAAFDRRDPRAR